MFTPYDGLRVIEVATDPAGEMTGLQFAQLGAEVIKVEPPEGAPSRHTGPFAAGWPDLDHSLAYWYYNSGKASVVVDLADGGFAALAPLLDGADVLICTLHPVQLRELGVDLQQESGRWPALTIVSITPFGLTGPWSDYRSSDLVAMAASGLLWTSGYDDHAIPPIRPGGDQSFHTAASFAHTAALLALIDRQRSGLGGLIDVSMHEAGALTVELSNPYWFYNGAIVQRQTCRHAQPVMTQPALFLCGDGRYVYFALILSDEKPWRMLVEWMESLGVATDLADDAYKDLSYRQENFAHIQDILEVLFLVQDAATAYHDGQARGLPIGILNSPEDLFADEHLRERQFFVEVDQPDHPGVTHPGPPYRFSGLAAAERRPAARLGEHTERYLTNAG